MRRQLLSRYSHLRGLWRLKDGPDERHALVAAMAEVYALMTREERRQVERLTGGN